MDKATNNLTLFNELSKLYSELYPNHLLYYNRCISHTINNIAQDIIKYAKYSDENTIDSNLVIPEIIEERGKL